MGVVGSIRKASVASSSCGTAGSAGSTPIECLARLACHVIVNRSSEAVELAERAPGRVPDTRLRDAAFVRLADDHLDKAYRLARAILRDPAEAQDATHDAFVQAWRKWETLRDQSKFEPWFDRILVNTCRNRLRSTRRTATDISAEVALATGDHTGSVEDRDVIGVAIAALSPDHQVVVALRYYRDLTVEDIARRLGVPSGTVQSRLHYALKRLHDAIDAADKGTTR
jgi:RNA polymerase sigma-70 factor (ECF subfamily)